MVESECGAGGFRPNISVAAPFGWRCLTCSPVAPVSTPRSSNRTCRSPASGSRTRSHAFTHDGPRPSWVKLHDIVAKRAKSWAASRDLQTGRASSNSPVAPDSSITEDEKEQGTRSERDARKVRLDDIDEMRREADAYTVQAAELRQIADVAP